MKYKHQPHNQLEPRMKYQKNNNKKISFSTSEWHMSWKTIKGKQLHLEAGHNKTVHIQYIFSSMSTLI